MRSDARLAGTGAAAALAAVVGWILGTWLRSDTETPREGLADRQNGAAWARMRDADPVASDGAPGRTNRVEVDAVEDRDAEATRLEAEIAAMRHYRDRLLASALVNRFKVDTGATERRLAGRLSGSLLIGTRSDLEEALETVSAQTVCDLWAAESRAFDPLRERAASGRKDPSIPDEFERARQRLREELAAIAAPPMVFTRLEALDVDTVVAHR